MENAVIETRLAAARYAYPKLVTAPGPTCPAKGRQIDVEQLERDRERGSRREDPEPRSQRRPGRTNRSRRHPRPRSARHASPTTGTASEIAPFEATPHHSAAIPSSSTRVRITRQRGRASERIPERRCRIVVERGEAARREPREEMRDRRRDEPAERVGADVLRWRPSPSPSADLRSLPRRPRRRAADGSETTASAVAKPATAPASRRSARARASEGSTATRIACDASTTTM